jgi:hypothetical protein
MCPGLRGEKPPKELLGILWHGLTRHRGPIHYSLHLELSLLRFQTKAYFGSREEHVLL